MRRNVSVCLLIVLLLAAVFAVSACTPSVTAFTVLLGKTVYEVDEAFDFEGSKLYVTFSDGSKRYVNVKEEMIERFDTSLSGQWEVTVKYADRTGSASYRVQGNVKTKTRLSANRGSGSECVIVLKNVDFPVYALSFTMTGAEIPESLSLLNEGWKMQTRTLETGVSVILYADNGKPIDEDIVLFNFLSTADAEFGFSEITAASEDAEYTLPNAALRSELVNEAKT